MPTTEITAKQPKKAKQNRFFDFYAGFPTSFVGDVLDKFQLRPSATVLDPWCGSGTTPFLSWLRGFSSIATDINPVIIDVAMARFFAPTEEDKLLATAKQIATQLISTGANSNHREPLQLWFGPTTAATFRRLASLIDEHTTNTTEHAHKSRYHARFSKAVLRLASYLVLDKYIQGFTGTNPTWITQSRHAEKRVSLPAARIAHAFERQCEAVVRQVTSLYGDSINDHYSSPRLLVATSDRLPVRTESVDAVITSPPYCSRLDYVINVAPQLAFRGLTPDAIVRLRNATIGTPTISPKSPTTAAVQLVPYAQDLLSLIRDHDSYAAESYYLKFFRQYFERMTFSLNEIDRVSKKNATAAIVVQDSHFKDLRIRLDVFVEESMKLRGWAVVDKISSDHKSLLVQLNTRSTRYRLDSTLSEHILMLSKTAQQGGRR